MIGSAKLGNQHSTASQSPDCVYGYINISKLFYNIGYNIGFICTILRGKICGVDVLLSVANCGKGIPRDYLMQKEIFLIFWFCYKKRLYLVGCVEIELLLARKQSISLIDVALIDVVKQYKTDMKLELIKVSSESC